MDKKTLSMIAAALIAAIGGASEMVTLGDRLDALEALHPELGVPEAPEPTEEAAPGKTEESEPEGTDPAPGVDDLELNEADEWVPAEEPEVEVEEPA